MRILAGCDRRYYYSYLAPRDFRAEPETVERQLCHLRYLVGEEAFIGTLVHEEIREMLLASIEDRPIDLEGAIRRAQLAYHATAYFGARLRLLQLDRHHAKLIHHHRGEPSTEAGIEAGRQKIADRLRTFLAIPAVASLLRGEEALEPGCLDVDGFEISTVLGVPALVKPDAVSCRGGVWTIWDWKSGRPAEWHRGVGANYDAYVRLAMKLPPAATVGTRFVYLDTGEVIDHEYARDERSERLWEIGVEYEDLKREAARAVRGVAAFPARVTPLCAFCSYQFICPEYRRRQEAAAQ